MYSGESGAQFAGNYSTRPLFKNKIGLDRALFF
jgi:hypothetical protein